MNEKTITPKEMMKILHIGRNTAYELIHSKGFYPAFRIGRKILINVDLLDEWRKERGRVEE